MTEMNYDDIKRMQAAAERRVNEMDRRSRSFVATLNSSGASLDSSGMSINASGTSVNSSVPPSSSSAAVGRELSQKPRFMTVRDAPTPKNIKMPVDFPERAVETHFDKTKNEIPAGKPHFVYEPPNTVNRTPTAGSGTVRTNVYGKNAGRSPLHFFDSLSRDDTERLFLLSLCMLLKNENADGELITALMYIMS